jgi:hypothetical protein
MVARKWRTGFCFLKSKVSLLADFNLIFPKSQFQFKSGKILVGDNST